MSEQLSHSPERQPGVIETTPQSEARLKQLQEAGRRASENDQLSRSVELLSRRAESQAVSGTELTAGERQQNTPTHAYGLQKELKDQAYTRTLKRAQSRLSAPERALSRVIHQPAVNAFSQVAGQTVGRPSGLFGGSVLAFLGSGGLLFVAKHYGFTYNYSAFLVLFVGGFILGLIFEMSARILRSGRSEES